MWKIKDSLSVLVVAGVMAVLGYLAGSHDTINELAAAADAAAPSARVPEKGQGETELRPTDNTIAHTYLKYV